MDASFFQKVVAVLTKCPIGIFFYHLDYKVSMRDEFLGFCRARFSRCQVLSFPIAFNVAMYSCWAEHELVGELSNGAFTEEVCGNNLFSNIQGVATHRAIED